MPIVTAARPSRYVPASYEPIKDVLQDVSAGHPDLVFVPRRDDAHQDHRLLGELAGSAFRDCLILEYEIPKYDGDLGQPNFYVALSTPHVEAKIEILLNRLAKTQSNAEFLSSLTKSLDA